MKNAIRAVKITNDQKTRKSKVKSPIKMEPTCRGFLRGEFKDANGQSCSIQASSAFGGEDGALLWLGVNNVEGDFQIQPQTFKTQEIYGFGWQQKNLKKMYPDCWVNVPDRMHLSQKQVKALLPSLQHFAETGELPI